MYRFIATGRHNVIRRSKKTFNSVISLSPPLSSSDAGTACFQQGITASPWPIRRSTVCRRCQLCSAPGDGGRPVRDGGKGGKDRGGSAEAAAQDLGLGPPALPWSGLWQHLVPVMMPWLPAGGWHGDEPPPWALPCLWHFSCLASQCRP